jgi:hypothetical protein
MAYAFERVNLLSACQGREGLPHSAAAGLGDIGNRAQTFDSIRNSMAAEWMHGEDPQAEGGNYDFWLIPGLDNGEQCQDHMQVRTSSGVLSSASEVSGV